MSAEVRGIFPFWVGLEDTHRDEVITICRMREVEEPFRRGVGLQIQIDPGWPVFQFGVCRRAKLSSEDPLDREIEGLEQAMGGRRVEITDDNVEDFRPHCLVHGGGCDGAHQEEEGPGG
jgi:hypothetical protein